MDVVRRGDVEIFRGDSRVLGKVLARRWAVFQQELFELLVRKRPEAVMVRATLEQALPPSFVDEVFERVAERQHTRVARWGLPQALSVL